MAALSLQKSLAAPSRKVVGVEVEQLIEGDERIRERLSEVLYHATAQVFIVLSKTKEKCTQTAIKDNEEQRLSKSHSQATVWVFLAFNQE